MAGVLFVCVRNSGKSQMAAGLLRARVGDDVEIHSAGTRPGESVNPHSAQALLEVGVDITGERPSAIDPDLAARMDHVITLGREATVDAVGGPAVENWDTVEPSHRGIEGMDRMRMIRDDIASRVDDLVDRLRAGT